MEWGFDGVLLNTAVSRALDPVRMAGAFAKAVKGGRSAFLAGPMIVQETAVPSTPEIGRPFAGPITSRRPGAWLDARVALPICVARTDTTYWLSEVRPL